MANKEFYTEKSMNKIKKEKKSEKQIIKVKLKDVCKTVVNKIESSMEIQVIKPVGE